uniref:Uncharacterized protein n=1 Tax=Hyaloperonospora arabidopsidis (strain Emoy2) TaxID=559515 RepID=M4BBX6_HYAAE
MALKDARKVVLPLTQPFCYAVVHNGTARGVELKLERREERERNEHDEGAERTGEETVAVDLEREHDGAEDDEIGEHDRRCHGDDEAVVTNRYTVTSLHEDDLADHFVSTYSLSIRVVTPM